MTVKPRSLGCGVILCMLVFLVVKKHRNGGSTDYDVTDNTQDVRNLLEEEEAEQSGKNNLGIIKNGYFACRCIGVGSCDGKLSARSGKAGK